MTDIAKAFAAGMGRFWRDEFGVDAAISGVSAASTGARRANVIFDLDEGSGPRRLVATIMPAGQLALNPIEIEAHVRRLVRSHGVAVPEVIAVSGDSGYVGGPFFVSAFVAGESIPRRVLRLAESSGNGPQIVRSIGLSLARLHSIDPALAPEGVLGSEPRDPGRDAVREAALAIEAMQPVRPALVWALEWLRANRPAPPERLTMVHTDVRNGNVLVSEDGLQAILDWEGLRRFGDPMQDLAWTAVRAWRFRNDSLEIGGLADRSALVDGYVEGGGTFDAERFHWWKVSMTLWWALGMHGQAMAHIDGTFSHIVMAASGRRVPEMEWDLLMLTKPTT